MADKNFPQISGMTLVISTFILFGVNIVVLFIAQMLFPQNIVLGTHSLTYQSALAMSMGVLSYLISFFMPFVSKYELMRAKIFSPFEWSALYLVVNLIGLWLITRAAQQFGLGVTSWMVIVPLAIALDVAQSLIMMIYGNLNKKSLNLN